MESTNCQLCNGGLDSRLRRQTNLCVVCFTNDEVVVKLPMADTLYNLESCTRYFFNGIPCYSYVELQPYVKA